jgi:esterase/lipase superfamily enzyme
MLAFGNGGGLPLILFPTSFGSYYQNKDFGLVGSVSGDVDAGQVTVYCPDAIDLESFYNKSIHPADRMRTHNAYENVIVRDVFDLARRECNCHRVAVCGASLGAYHAANIAFRHPDTVSHLISLSGSFDISSFFDGYHDDNIYFNSPYEYLPNVTDPWNTITWASSLAPANGITPATNRIGFRNSEFKRHQALARRRKMAWPRMELLARHAAVLFVEDLAGS